MKVLAIIDDEQEMEEIYSMLLEEHVISGELDLHFFDDSRNFIKWLEYHTPDLVLCDINMPHISGVEVARHLKERDLENRVYFISGYDHTAYATIMSELGVSRFFSKPLNYDDVLNSINSELGL